MSLDEMAAEELKSLAQNIIKVCKENNTDIQMSRSIGVPIIDAIELYRYKRNTCINTYAKKWYDDRIEELENILKEWEENN